MTISNPTHRSLSTRISLRWIPDPAFETTDTLVMSLMGWYVDLRVDKESGMIDWAIAGKRIIESENPLRVLFTHEIDSRNSFDDTDCGTFTTLPNGDDLEVGFMRRSDLPGAPVCAYEEVWRELEPRGGPDGPGGVSWVIEGCEGNVDGGDVAIVTRTFIVRIWGTFLAVRQRQTQVRLADSLIKDGGEVSARREEWAPSVGWETRYALGPEADELPSMKTIHEDNQWSIGKKLEIGGAPYTIRALEKIQTLNQPMH